MTKIYFARRSRRRGGGRRRRKRRRKAVRNSLGEKRHKKSYISNMKQAYMYPDYKELMEYEKRGSSCYRSQNLESAGFITPALERRKCNPSTQIGSALNIYRIIF